MIISSKTSCNNEPRHTGQNRITTHCPVPFCLGNGFDTVNGFFLLLRFAEAILQKLEQPYINPKTQIDMNFIELTSADGTPFIGNINLLQLVYQKDGIVFLAGWHNGADLQVRESYEVVLNKINAHLNNPFAPLIPRE